MSMTREPPKILANQNTNTSTGLSVLAPNIGTSNNIGIILGRDLSSNNYATMGFQYVGASSTNNYLYLGANVANTLCITATGNVGIGLTNPPHTLSAFSNIAVPTITTAAIWPCQLSVIGQVGGQMQLKLGSYYTGGVGSYCAIQATETYSGAEHPQSLIIQPIGGQVGIGSTSIPQYCPLYVYSNLNSGSGWDGRGYFGNNIGGFVCGYYGNGVLIGGHNASLGAWANMTIGAPTTTTTIPGALSKGSGTFDIAHPLYSDHKKRLVHSFIEGPRCDLIYRGIKQLVNGTIAININKECTYSSNNAMDEGTFEALCANAECFLQNKSSFSRVMGAISGCILTITCENATNDIIVWMVIAERKDSFIKKWNRTDDNGFLITQYTDENHIDI